MQQELCHLLIEEGALALSESVRHVLLSAGLTFSVGCISSVQHHRKTAIILNLKESCSESRVQTLESLVLAGSVIVGAWIIDAALSPYSSKDLRSLVAKSQQTFDNVIITRTGFSELENRYTNVLASAVGIRVENDFTQEVTHLLAMATGSPKHSAALQMHIPCITYQWLEECLSKGEISPHSEFKTPSLLGITVSVSQLNLSERESIKALVEDHGGKYSPDLAFDCTHLIAVKPEGNKYEFAKKWKVKVVRKAWIMAMIESQGCLDVNPYLLDQVEQCLSLPLSDAPLSLSVCISSQVKSTGFPEVIEYDPVCDNYLSGCVAVLNGFVDERFRYQLTRILRFGGATILDKVRPFATHVITDSCNNGPNTSFYQGSVVNVLWLIDCYKSKSRVTISQRHRPKSSSGSQVPKLSSTLVPVAFDDLSFQSNQRPIPEQTECLSVAGLAPNVPISSPTNFSSFNRSLDKSSSGVGHLESHVFHHLLFSGKNFCLDHLSLDNTERDEARHDIIAHGGTITEAGHSSAVVLHFVLARHLLPCRDDPSPLFAEIEQAWSNQSFSKPIMITFDWIHSCIEQKCLLSPCASIGFLPLPKNQKKKAFHDHGIALSLSQFVGKERDLIGSITRKFGGRCRDMFSKRHTHLICKFMDQNMNQKQVMALKWNVPAVHISWLYDSVINGYPLQTKYYEQLLATSVNQSLSSNTERLEFASILSRSLESAIKGPNNPPSQAEVPGSVSKASVEKLKSANLKESCEQRELQPKGVATSPKNNGKNKSALAVLPCENLPLSETLVSVMPTAMITPKNRFQMAQHDARFFALPDKPVTNSDVSAINVDESVDAVHVCPDKSQAISVLPPTTSLKKRRCKVDAIDKPGKRFHPMNSTPLACPKLASSKTCSHRFVLSTSIGSKSKELSKAIISLGGEIVDTNSEDFGSCTHVVVGVLSRVEKVLHGILLGKWIVKPTMIEESKRQRSFVSHEAHDWAVDASLSSDPAQVAFSRAMYHWRQAAIGPFFGFAVLICVASSNALCFERLLRAGGCENIYFVNEKHDVSADVESLISHALFDVNTLLEFQEPLLKMKSLGIPCLRADFVIDRIIDINCNISDLSEYAVNALPPPVSVPSIVSKERAARLSSSASVRRRSTRRNPVSKS